MSSSAPAPPAPTGNRYPNQMPHYGMNSGVLLTAILCFIFIVLIVCVLQVCARHIISRHSHSRATAAAAIHQQSGNAGLDACALASLPTFRYGKGNLGRRQHEEAVEVNECVICLTAMEEGDAVRLLPNCRHLLHVVCVDKWLRFHSTCPACRTAAAPVKVDDGNRRAVAAVDGAGPTTAAPPGTELHNEDVENGEMQRGEEVGSTSALGASIKRKMSIQWSRKTAANAGGVEDLERQ